MGAKQMKIKVIVPNYYDRPKVFLKMVKVGRTVLTRGWTKFVRAFIMKEGRI